MNKTNKLILLFIIITNSIVLLGQLWPAGAPPFARVFNIVTLIINLLITILFFFKHNK